MALATYDDLVTSILKWSHRNDVDMDDLIPDFISMAESDMFANAEEILEPRSIEKTSTATAVGTSPNESRFIELPPRYIQQRDFRITYLNKELKLTYHTPNAMRILDGTGLPCNFTVTNQIELDTVPDQDYTLTMKYYAKPAPLTPDNQTNEILTSDPSIYLYGALHQCFLWSEDDNEANKYWLKFITAIRGANKRAKAGRYGASPAIKFVGSVA
jgi:hypothetical protein